jgi:hypothetical protein
MGLIGRDGLGMAHRKFPIGKFIQSTPENWAIGGLDDWFGNLVPRIQKCLSATNAAGDARKFPAYRIHLWWDNSHGLIPIGELRKRAKKYELIARANSDVDFYLSHTLELASRDAAELRKRLKILEDTAPSCTPVNCVWGGKGRIMPGYVNEQHGVNGKPRGDVEYITSTDGVNIYDIDAVKWNLDHDDALIRFLWGLRDNLREVLDPGEKPPLPKVRNAAPSLPYLNGVVRLGYPMGTPLMPQFGGQVYPVKAPLVYKPFSEDDQEKDPREPDERRELRPCLIVPFKGPVIDVVTYDGKALGQFIRMNQGGDASGGMTRFYSGLPKGIGLYGQEIAEKAEAVSGSEFVWFRCPGRGMFYGPVHPAFRHGVMREHS